MAPDRLDTGTRKALLAATLLAVAITLSETGAGGQLPHVAAVSAGTAERVAYDGAVEAVRQTVVAAQVAGTIVALEVKAGDRVKAGQLLARIDARAAEQTTAASVAQVQAARAALEVATREVERQRQLYQKRYISEAALDRAEAQFKSTHAQVNAQLAQANAARTQTGFFLVRAPYEGIVSDVPVALGDMAMPGRPLATLYDPSALRIAATVPQTALPPSLAAQATQVELPAGPDRKGLWLVPARVTVLPTVDAASHTVVVRLDLPPNGDLKPGMFPRVAAGSCRDGRWQDPHSDAGSGAPGGADRRLRARRGEPRAAPPGPPRARERRSGRGPGRRVGGRARRHRPAGGGPPVPGLEVSAAR